MAVLSKFFYFSIILIFITSPASGQIIASSIKKQDIAKEISGRTYIIITPIKPIVVYFGPNGRGAAVLANDDTPSFKIMSWSIRGVSSGYGACWTGHGKGSSCVSIQQLKSNKSYQGDYFSLLQRKSSTELMQVLQY